MVVGGCGVGGGRLGASHRSSACLGISVPMPHPSQHSRGCPVTQGDGQSASAVASGLLCLINNGLFILRLFIGR